MIYTFYKNRLIKINTKMICAVNDITATIKALKPNLNILLNEIFKPIPAIAITKVNLDN